VLIKPPFAGKLCGFTLLFEALVLMLAPQMPLAAVARIVGISDHRVLAICKRCVGLALAQAHSSAAGSAPSSCASARLTKSVFGAVTFASGHAT
jgi:uncharacterized membrane protein